MNIGENSQAKSTEDEPALVPTQVARGARHAEGFSEAKVSTSGNAFETMSLQVQDHGDPEIAVAVKAKEEESLVSEKCASLSEHQGEPNSAPQLGTTACDDLQKDIGDATGGGQHDPSSGIDFVISNENKFSVCNFIKYENDRRRGGHENDLFAGTVMSCEPNIMLGSMQREQNNEDDRTTGGNEDDLPGGTIPSIDPACDIIRNDDDLKNRGHEDGHSCKSGTFISSNQLTSLESMQHEEAADFDEDDITRRCHEDDLSSETDQMMCCKDQNSSFAYDGRNECNGTRGAHGDDWPGATGLPMSFEQNAILTDIQNEHIVDSRENKGNITSESLREECAGNIADNYANIISENLSEEQAVNIADNYTNVTTGKLLDERPLVVAVDADKIPLENLQDDMRQFMDDPPRSLQDEQPVDLVDDVEKTPLTGLQNSKQRFDDSDKIPLRSLQVDQPVGVIADLSRSLQDKWVANTMDGGYNLTLRSFEDVQIADKKANITLGILQDKQLLDLADSQFMTHNMEELVVAESLKNPHITTSAALQNEQPLDVVDNGNNIHLESLQTGFTRDKKSPKSLQEGDDCNMTSLESLHDKEPVNMVDGVCNFTLGNFQGEQLVDSNNNKTSGILQDKQLIDLVYSSSIRDEVQAVDLAESLNGLNERTSSGMQDMGLVKVVDIVDKTPIKSLQTNLAVGDGDKIHLRGLQTSQRMESVEDVNMANLRSLQDCVLDITDDVYSSTSKGLQGKADSCYRGISTSLQGKQLVDLLDGTVNVQGMAVDMSGSLNKNPDMTACRSLRDAQMVDAVIDIDKMPLISLQAKQQVSTSMDGDYKMPSRTLQDAQLVDKMPLRNPDDKQQMDDMNVIPPNGLRDKERVDMAHERLQNKHCVDLVAQQDEQAVDMPSGLENCEKTISSNQMIDMAKDTALEDLQDRHQGNMAVDRRDKISLRDLDDKKHVDIVDDMSTTIPGRLQGKQVDDVGNSMDKIISENFEGMQLVSLAEHNTIVQDMHTADMTHSSNIFEKSVSANLADKRLGRPVDDGDKQSLRSLQDTQLVKAVMDDIVKTPVGTIQDEQALNMVENMSVIPLTSLKDNQVTDMVDKVCNSSSKSLEHNGGVVGEENVTVTLESLTAYLSIESELVSDQAAVHEASVNGFLSSDTCFTEGEMGTTAVQVGSIIVPDKQTVRTEENGKVMSESLTGNMRIASELVSDEAVTHGAVVTGVVNSDVDGEMGTSGVQVGSIMVSNSSLLEKQTTATEIGVSATLSDGGEREFEADIEQNEEKPHYLSFIPFEHTGMVTSLPKKSPIPAESTQADRKRASDHFAPERRCKRGRKPVVNHLPPEEEEDVCFVCFDGGNLILCDKKSCPKAYHVECTGRESDFFRKKGQWFCGWHVCAYCSRSATSHCYTCPSAYCNNCIKNSNFVFIQDDQGLCEGCYPIVQMIEHNEMINADGVKVDFNDKETYEYLFKEYWEDLKQKNVITLEEFEKACKAKEAGKPLSDDTERSLAEEEAGSMDSDSKPRTRASSVYLKRKRMTQASVVEDASGSEYEDEGGEGEGEEVDDEEDEADHKPKRGRKKAPEFDGWASRELLEFLQSMKEDHKKSHSLLMVKNLLWRYVESNKLFNPRKRGQIQCDERLQKLFGKKHVGRFEMLKLLSSHVAASSGSAKSWDCDSDKDDDNGEAKYGDKDRKSRRKAYDEHSKPDRSDFAAVDMKNVNLIYVKRSLLEDLRGTRDFENKLVDSFVRIRVPGMVNKNETCYRLVKVVGIKHNPAKPNEVVLEIMNLQKREEVMADAISNQDFTEEECQRLRQTIRYGVLKPMTVGELEEKALALREFKIKDWFETELLRLSHLRDRASEKGHKKELRECVEKIQLLSSQEERERQLRTPLDIKADPRMDPSYESEDEDVPPDDHQERWRIASPSKSGEKSKNTDNNVLDNDEGNVKLQSRDSKPKASTWNHNDHGSVPANESQKQGWNPVVGNSKEPKRSWGNTVLNSDRNDGLNNKGGGGQRCGDRRSGNTEQDTWGNFDEKNTGGHAGEKINSTEKETGWGSNKEELNGRWSNTKGNPAWSRQGSLDQREGGDWGNNVRNTGRNLDRSHQGSFGKGGGGIWTDVHGTERKGGWDGEHEQSFGRAGWGVDAGNVERNPGWNNPPSMTRSEVSFEKGRPAFSNTTGADFEATDWEGTRDRIMSASLPEAAHAGPAAAELSSTKLVDNEKVWFYQDPTKTVQGPFSIEQLRKWEKTKLFPVDLRVWRTTDGQNASILLTDLLAGKHVSNPNLELPQANDYVQVGWGVAAVPSEVDFKSSLCPNNAGNDRGRREVWDQGGFDNKANQGGAWNVGWAASGNPAKFANYRWPTGNAWAPQAPDKLFQGSRDRPWQGGEATFRDTIHHNDQRLGRRDNMGWGAKPHSSCGGGELSQAGRSASFRGRMGGQGGNFQFPTPKKDCPCKYFERGMCKKGQSCEFKH